MKSSTKKEQLNKMFEKNLADKFLGNSSSNTSTEKLPIRLLPQRLINQIAAGEVIERPASVIKELVENAIDAGASEITVEIVDGGKNFISVSDNGSGMDKDALEMCILSHATSKLSSENLFDIHTFGFRGEALPSIASVSRLSIITSDNNEGEAWRLQMEGQEEIESVSPANRPRGTTLEVKDLFFATPARLKFLKSDSYETEKCRTVFNNIALANCSVSFRFVESVDTKACYKKTENLAQRIEDIFGNSFVKNMFEVNSNKDKRALVSNIYEGMSLRGYSGVPTFNKSSSNQQYFFVNGRLVKDKVMASALRSAYTGLVPHGRYPVAVLFLELPYNEVDVNVHPAKTEVRFRNIEKVRNFVALELRKAIESKGSKRSTTEIMDKFYANAIEVPTQNGGMMRSAASSWGSSASGSFREYDGGSATATAVGLHVAETMVQKDAQHLSEPTILRNEYADRANAESHVESAMEFPKSAGIFTFPTPNRSASFSGSSGGGFSASSRSATADSAPAWGPSKNSLMADLFQIERENGIGFDGTQGSDFPRKFQDDCNTKSRAKSGLLETVHGSISEKTASPANYSEDRGEICLGNAVFQVNNTYIVAESDEGITIVDQHAAAERIMLEELKRNLKITSQNLLMPPKMKLTQANMELLKTYDDLLKNLGVYVEYEDINTTAAGKDKADNVAATATICAIPAILETSDIDQLLNDIIDELSSFGDAYTLDDKLHKVLSTISCHSSLRAGKKLSIQEMNYLLRKMELTTNIAQCCHGRPSYIKLSIKDLNIFFERT